MGGGKENRFVAKEMKFFSSEERMIKKSLKPVRFQIVSVLNVCERGYGSWRLCVAVIRTLTSLISGDEEARAMFASEVTYHRLLKLVCLLESQEVTDTVCDAIVDMMLEQRYAVGIHQLIRNTRAAKMLVKLGRVRGSIAVKVDPIFWGGTISFVYIFFGLVITIPSLPSFFSPSLFFLIFLIATAASLAGFARFKRGLSSKCICSERRGSYDRHFTVVWRSSTTVA